MSEDQLVEISEGRKKKLEQLALSVEDYREIVRRLGRHPSDLLLEIFAAMWSEHCSYRYSRPLLQKYFGALPMPPYVRIEANAGAINIDAGSRHFAQRGDIL